MPTKVPLPSRALAGVEERTAIRRGYLPLKAGFRFSRNARVPSA
jgi:hypothetical protein